jgi:hypothetical protein
MDGLDHDLRMVARFAMHTIVALLLFGLIGGAAALLAYYVTVLGRLGISPLILHAIHATEYFLFAVDLLCFVTYVSHETWVLLRAILAGPAGRPTDEATPTDLPR